MGIDGRVDARARHGLRKTLLASSITATITLLAGEAAWADCTPAAADGVTATCINTTTNQGAGAPGTSAGSSGYGTGIETGVTVNNTGFLSGTAAGIYLGDGTVANTSQSSPSQIFGNQYGIRAATGSLNVTNNDGAIVSGGGGVGAVGIQAATNVTVVNGGSTQGYAAAIQALAGSANVTNNFGFIGAIQAGGVVIQANSDVTVINSGAISGAGGAILSTFGNANVTNNSGYIIAQHSGSGIQARAVTVINNAGALISGAYGIDAQGVSSASSVFNAGQIEGGFAAIRFSAIGNTLTLGPGSDITGNVTGGLLNTFQLGGTGAASFDISQLGPKYQNFTTFNKIDGSVWTLTGTSSYAGPVNVNGGTLNVTGNIASAAGITVNTGATLGGTGTLGATVVASGGTLSPGNGTAGTSLSVTGNLAFSLGASYLVQVNPATASSTAVNGSATLGSATVNANFATGAYVEKQYTILTTTGGLSGTFAGVTSNNMPTNVHPKLAYDSNNAYINMVLSFVVPVALLAIRARSPTR